MRKFLFTALFCSLSYTISEKWYYLNAGENQSLLKDPSYCLHESHPCSQETLEALHRSKKNRKHCKHCKPPKESLREYIGAFTQNTAVKSDGTVHSLFPFDNIGANSNIVFVDSIRSFSTSAAGDYEILFNITVGDFFNGTTPVARVLINDVPEVTALPSALLSKAPPTGNITISGMVNLPANSTIALQYTDVNREQIYAVRQVSAVIKQVD